MPNFVKIGGVTRKPLVDLTRNDQKFNVLMTTCVGVIFHLLVGQIMGPIVQIVIQAPTLARMFFGDYWSNLPKGPLENPRWRPFFQDGRHFQYNFFF